MLFKLILIYFLILSCENESKHKINEADLFPEGITYSKKTKQFYISSIHKQKIIQFDAESKNHKDFISQNEFDFKNGIGLFADDKRMLLWAISSETNEKNLGSSLYKFDLVSGDFLAKYDSPNDKRHFFNDLTIAQNGDIFVTDSDSHSIYRLQGDSLKLFYQNTEIEYPNGIDIDRKHNRLFIASFTKGIRILDIKTKTILNKADDTNLTLAVDGLKFVNNHLFAVQNAFQTKSNHQLLLVEVQDNFTFKKKNVFFKGNPDLDIPTTFCISENELVLIANSQLDNLDQEKNVIINKNILKEIVLLRTSSIPI